MFNAPITINWVIKKLCFLKDTLKHWVFQDIYSIKSVYLEAFKLCPKVRWRFVVWNRMSLPRHHFCIWLMALGKLKTKDKLRALVVISDDLCPLCATATEMTSHLFFECPFSRKCLEGIEAWVGVRFKNIATMNFRKHKLKKKQQQAVCDVYTCTVYVIWRSRNTAVWDT